MRRYKVVPPMYRRNRPMAGFPVLNPRRGGRASKSPKNAQSAADTLIGSLRRASLSPYVGMIQIRSRVKTMAVSSQPGNTDSPLFSSVYCTPLFQILQPFPTKNRRGPAGFSSPLHRNGVDRAAVGCVKHPALPVFLRCPRHPGHPAHDGKYLRHYRRAHPAADAPALVDLDLHASPPSVRGAPSGRLHSGGQTAGAFFHYSPHRRRSTRGFSAGGTFLQPFRLKERNFYRGESQVCFRFGIYFALFLCYSEKCYVDHPLN